MSDKKKTADEIVDDLAQEMGVDDSNDAMSGVDDIFGVGMRKKKKKKKVAPVEEIVAEEEPAAEWTEPPMSGDSDVEDLEDDAKEDVAERVVVAKKTPEAAPVKKKKKKSAGVDGLFATGSDVGLDEDSEPVYKTKKSPKRDFLDDDDLGDYDIKQGPNTAVIGMGVVIVVLLGVVGFLAFGQGDDSLETGEELGFFQKIGLIVKGDYREYKLARKRRIEEEYEAAQLAKVVRYGNLTIDGSPLYARIKINGDAQYAPIADDFYREIRLQPGVSNFQDLPIKTPYNIEISAPGYQPKTYKITEGMWQGIKKDNPTATGQYNLTANLMPVSTEAQQEYEARMSSDTENEFFGTVTLNSVPAGAAITFNNRPLLDKDGKPLVTPVTFDKYYVVNDKEGSKNKGKLEEIPVRVDTTMDLGHKIQITPPNGMPKFAVQLERQLWVCNKKPEAQLKKLKKDHSIQEECDYTYTLNADTTAIKTYLDRIKAERDAVIAENKKNAEEKAKKEQAKADEEAAAVKEFEAKTN